MFLGQARVVDGDTVAFGDQRIRLAGIDAPEKQQTCLRDELEWACGIKATETLATFIEGKQLRCTTRGYDQYDRALATCLVGQADVARMMLDAGLAFANDDAPEEYKTAHQRAQDLKVGMWDGAVQLPARWRAEHPSVTTAAPAVVRSSPQKPLHANSLQKVTRSLVANVLSRATEAGVANGSITCRAGPTTHRRAPKSGSVLKPKHKLQGIDAQKREWNLGTQCNVPFDRAANSSILRTMAAKAAAPATSPLISNSSERSAARSAASTPYLLMKCTAQAHASHVLIMREPFRLPRRLHTDGLREGLRTRPSIAASCVRLRSFPNPSLGPDS